MAYIGTDKVTVFPSSLRAGPNGDRASGKYTSEENLTGIIKTLANKDSFIINWDTDNNKAELVINGYYFKLTELPSISGTLFANIYLDEANRLFNKDNDSRLDIGNEFYGISFDSSAGSSTSNYTCYSLKIRDGNTVIEANKHKFNADTIFLNSGSSVESLFTGSILNVSKGGTGASSVGTENQVLTGGTTHINTRDIINNTNASTPIVGSTNIPTMNTLLNSLAQINGSIQKGETSIYAPTNSGTSKYILVAQNNAAPIWTAPATVAANILNDQNLTTKTSTTGGTDYLLGGNSSTAFKILPENLKVKGLANSTLLQTDLASTSAVSFDGISSGYSIGVTGILPVSNGGTGLNSFTNNTILLGTSSGIGSLGYSNGALYSTGSNNLQFGVLPASQGGTGQSSLSNVTVGVANKVGTGSVGAPNINSTGDMTFVYINNGTPTAGNKVYYRTSAFSATSSTGNNGDICIVYVSN